MIVVVIEKEAVLDWVCTCMRPLCALLFCAVLRCLISLEGALALAKLWR